MSVILVAIYVRAKTTGLALIKIYGGFNTNTVEVLMSINNEHCAYVSGNFVVL